MGAGTQVGYLLVVFIIPYSTADLTAKQLAAACPHEPRYCIKRVSNRVMYLVRIPFRRRPKRQADKKIALQRLRRARAGLQ